MTKSNYRNDNTDNSLNRFVLQHKSKGFLAGVKRTKNGITIYFTEHYWHAKTFRTRRAARRAVRRHSSGLLYPDFRIYTVYKRVL